MTKETRVNQDDQEGLDYLELKESLMPCDDLKGRPGAPGQPGLPGRDGEDSTPGKAEYPE